MKQPETSRTPESAHRRSVQPDCSAPAFVVTQDMVNEIVKRAKDSPYGLHNEPEKSLDLNQYREADTESLALMLVSAWTEKYDLVSVFYAAMEVIKEKAQNAADHRQPPT